MLENGEMLVESFFLFKSQCFQEPSYSGLLTLGLFSTEFNLYHKITTFNDLSIKSFEKIMEKGDKCWLPAFSPFPIMFSLLSRTNFTFSVTFILSSATASKLASSKILLFGKEFNSVFCSVKSLQNDLSKYKATSKGILNVT